MKNRLDCKKKDDCVMNVFNPSCWWWLIWHSCALDERSLSIGRVVVGVCRYIQFLNEMGKYPKYMKN